MMPVGKKFVAVATTTINAPPDKVWEALTKPELIRQYFFGTEVSTDWAVGSPITYRGEWEGQAYEDRGKILQVVPEKLLVSTFWSSLSGLADTPENHNTVRYELYPEKDGTRLTVIQDNNTTQAEADQSNQNWEKVLSDLKKLLEG